ncbi:6-phosphogluconolactonase (cycloisomerase 2 family) [Microbacterium endophyticum]|uniref:6-phosphogluconolactonase (Cycloisomerase 2 family) n=1 Tax=Microbacterium endophyticum TaxID=1526412 RepID=A0A7W4YPW4_9MICO|nr:beta-propeller fold lactonase family protein [Microbacterium endophyticum]MBB2977171.1 6-phosphogluconolactonase (cycloisomerase 2 family) [Microbacterium endophyticum]NIK36025.1 6-phosphogluconolactonase (cycloisomerase 2 family) [Microbacterium endophyticum]
MRILTGGYTADMGGVGEGIGEVVAGARDDVLAGGQLRFSGTVAPAQSPSWVTKHPTLDIVYAALEGRGVVQAFRRVGETAFVELGRPIEAGEMTCHVAVAPDASELAVSCWGDGRVVRMPLDSAGVPRGRHVLASAVDPHGVGEPAGAAAPEQPESEIEQARQALRDAAGAEYAHLLGDEEPLPFSVSANAADLALFEGATQIGATETGGGEPDAAARASRAHQVRYLPHGVVATVDMGYDLVRFWRHGADGELRFAQEVVFPRGSGPRHTVWHPSGHLYVITELSHEVFVLAPNPMGHWRIISSLAFGAGLMTTDTAAELAPSRDGAFLYAGVRGSNTIATLRVDGAGESISAVALVDAGVNWPRHHAIVRDTLLVAGQLSDEVASLSLDDRTGIPGRVRHRVDVASPTCLVPVR